MAITMPEVAATRGEFRRQIREALETLVEDGTEQVEGGPWDGVPVVTRKTLDEAVATVFRTPIPAPDEHAAEVTTPAQVGVSAICPRCGLPALIGLSIRPELLVDEDSAELRLKAKAKARTHVCGQLSLADAPPVDQMDFELGDIAQPGDEVEETVNATAVDTCPFPGCALEAEHEGEHDVPPAVN